MISAELNPEHMPAHAAQALIAFMIGAEVCEGRRVTEEEARGAALLLATFARAALGCGLSPGEIVRRWPTPGSCSKPAPFAVPVVVTFAANDPSSPEGVATKSHAFDLVIPMSAIAAAYTPSDN